MKTSALMYALIVIVIILGGWYLFSSMGQQPQVLAPAVQQPAVTEPTVQQPATVQQPVAVPSTNTGLNGAVTQTNTGNVAVSPILKVSTDPKLGKYLVASNGMTLYMFTKDTKNTSNCSGACVNIWPAYSPAANEPLQATKDITGLLSTMTRIDGSTQLTYKGVPLYFFKSDIKPGDVLGQNVNGIWFVVKP